MLILAIIAAGMFVGWVAQLILGANSRTTDWGMALIAGIAGSFVGGLLVSLIAGLQVQKFESVEERTRACMIFSLLIGVIVLLVGL